MVPRRTSVYLPGAFFLTICFGFPLTVAKPLFPSGPFPLRILKETAKAVSHQGGEQNEHKKKNHADRRRGGGRVFRSSRAGGWNGRSCAVRGFVVRRVRSSVFLQNRAFVRDEGSYDRERLFVEKEKSDGPRPIRVMGVEERDSVREGSRIQEKREDLYCQPEAFLRSGKGSEQQDVDLIEEDRNHVGFHRKADAGQLPLDSRVPGFLFWGKNDRSARLRLLFIRNERLEGSRLPFRQPYGDVFEDRESSVQRQMVRQSPHGIRSSRIFHPVSDEMESCEEDFREVTESRTQQEKRRSGSSASSFFRIMRTTVRRFYIAGATSDVFPPLHHII